MERAVIPVIRPAALLWLVVATATAAAGFAPVFEPGALVLPLSLALAPFVVTGLLSLWRRRFQRIWHLLAAVQALLALVVGLLGSPGPAAARALWHGVVDSWARTLDTSWPAAGEADLVLFVPLLAVAAIALGEELRRAAGPVLALLPPLGVLVLGQLFTAATGARSVLLAVVFAAVGTAFVLACRAPAGSHLSRAGLQRALVMGVVLAVAAPVVAAADPIGRDAYSLKERRDSARLPSVASNPLDDVSARLRAPDDVVFRFISTAPPERWTLAVLPDFDGSTWTNAAPFAPLGASLPGDPGVTSPLSRSTAAVKVEDLRGAFVPVPSRVVAVQGLTAAVSVETATLVTSTPLPGQQYTVDWAEPTATTPPPLSLPLSFDVAARPLTQLPREIAELAQQAAGGLPATLQTALQLESFLRQEYGKATPPLPGGHGYPQLLDFLLARKTGTSEQFAASYVVLARALGLPARLAVGFRSPAEIEDGAYVVRNSDVLVWPEVRVATVGWLPLDPSSTVTGGAATKKRSLAAAIAAARSSLPSAPKQTEVNPDAAAPLPREDGTAVLTVVLWVLTGLAAVVVLYIVAVLLLTARRRRKRRSAAGAGAVVGAWHEARDLLRAAGVSVSSGATVRDLHPLSQGLVTAEPVEQLARVVDVALWSGRDVGADAATAAWGTVHELRSQLAARPWRRRVVARVDPRPLLPVPAADALQSAPA